MSYANHRERASDDLTEKMEKLYRCGMSVAKIAETMFFSRTGVRYRLQKAGVPLQHGHRARIAPDDPLSAEIVRLYESGLSTMAISGIVPLCETAVRSRLHKAGIKLRPPHQKRVPDEIIEKMCELRRDGATYKKISQICEVSEPTVRKYTKGIAKGA